MKKSLEILEKMAALQYRINQNDKKPRSFGTDHLLYQSEIHFIDAIGTDVEVNASDLSKKLGITNGAVTQVASKLIKKMLIEKYKNSKNKKEVYFKLTESGKVAYHEHVLFHKTLNDKMIAYLDGLSDEQVQGVLGMLDIADHHLPKL